MKQIEKEELKKHMDEIISRTFIRLGNAYRNQEVNKTEFEKVGSRLVFPSYYKDKRPIETRISEQELRFIFVEVFNAYCDMEQLDLYYSVETPTKDTYKYFADSKENPMPHDKGRSAEFDLVIFDEHMNRRCLVEFKAKNANEHDHKKDFVKLNNPIEGGNDVLRYFIEVIKSYNDNTKDSLKTKLDNNTAIKASFHCYALEGESKRNGAGQTDGKDITKDIVEP